MHNIFNKKRSLFLSGCLLIASLVACDEVEVSRDLPGVPATGFFAAVGANQHSGEDGVQVGVALFDDGVPVNLVGGDVVEASTANDSILLLERGFFTGSYVATLPNDANLDQVDFVIVHDPVGARDNRWYPVDLFNIDPGPGELVGASSTITLPSELVLTGPVADTVFTSIGDSITVSWNALAAGDTMIIRSAVTCEEGDKILTYGTEVDFTDSSDDGVETILMSRFIYDSNNSGVDPSFEFLAGEARAMLQELLEKLTNGAANNAFFEAIVPVNPVVSECEIQMFLFRQRPGSFANPSVNGTIFGARSAEVTIFYSPI